MEATLLMGVILPMVVAIMIAGFYIHDRSCMQSEACELAALGSCMRLYDDRETRISKRAAELSKGRLSWTGGVSASASAGETAAQGNLSGQFPIPGLIAQLWSGGQVQLETDWTYKITDPSRTIRRLRGAKAAVQQVKG
ncbi:MAG: hypothetical protein Q4B59_05610, partial [Lachnospiraceae bacterium]|nr:hypothetical protein [Lachnospiraceae bacterium]